MGETRKIEIGPQPGPQTQAMKSAADILFFGGEAGGGKTAFLLLDPLRYLQVPNFGYVLFRRLSTHITNQGGMWDTSMEFYPWLGGRPIRDPASWRFPNGFSCQMAHL